MRTSITSSLVLLFLSVGTAVAQKSAQLQVGQSATAALTADDTLRYELDLPAGQFVAGRVEQDDVDATVSVTDPAGKQVLRSARVGEGGPEAADGRGLRGRGHVLNEKQGRRWRSHVTRSSAGC